MNEKLLLTAIKDKYRFPYKGNISIEDLFDLRLRELDEVYKKLKSLIKEEAEVSLLSVKNTENEELKNKMTIVEYVFAEKQNEQLLRNENIKRKEQLEKLLLIKEAKQDEALKSMSIEEINKQIAELEK